MRKNLTPTRVFPITSSILNIPEYLIPSIRKKRKKLISIYGLIAELNRCFFFNKQECFYGANNYVMKLIKIIKQLFLINNYYIVVNQGVNLYHNLTKFYIIFLNFLTLYTLKKNALVLLQTISRPRRHVYITYLQLTKLVANSSNTSFILNTTQGLVLHPLALQQRQGGQLLCKLK